jgi:hypothetical protein
MVGLDGVRPVYDRPRASGLKGPAHMEAAVGASVCRLSSAEVKIEFDGIAERPAALARREALDRLSLPERDCQIVGPRWCRQISVISHKRLLSHNWQVGEIGLQPDGYPRRSDRIEGLAHAYAVQKPSSSQSEKRLID